ncbi:MAG: glycosyltransferase family 4 protein [Candidatus Brocadiia bacterium]
MKVVHIITRLILGGAQENTLITVEGLQRMPGYPSAVSDLSADSQTKERYSRGYSADKSFLQLPKYEVTLISGPALGPEGELVKRAQDNKVNLIIISQMRRNIFPWLDLISFIRIFFLLRKLKPDIVHTHSTKAGIFGRIAAKLAGVKIIIHTIHGMPFYPYQPRIANWFYTALEWLAAKVTDRIICVADAMTAQALAAGVGKPEQYTTIYSALEMDKFVPLKTRLEERRELGIGPDDKVIGVVARLANLKGHEYLIRIAHQIIREVPEVKLMFVGDGALREQITKDVKERGLVGRVIFTGLVEPQRIPGLIQAMDVLVHPSLREGLARALPQALALGRPAVSFDIDGAREVVLDGRTGFIIPPPQAGREYDSLDKMAEKIIYLLKNPAEAAKMGQAGKEHIKQNFDSAYMVSRIGQVYEEAAKQKSAPPTSL